MPKDKIITHGRGLQAAWNVLPKNLDARHARDCRGQRERGRRVFSIVEQGPLQPLCMKKFGHLLARQFFRTAIRFAFASGSETQDGVAFRAVGAVAHWRAIAQAWRQIVHALTGVVGRCPRLVEFGFGT